MSEIALLVGEKRTGESKKAILACNDYLRMGAGRSSQMRIALIDTTKKQTVYPVALLKIGAWRKSLGDECVLFRNKLPEFIDAYTWTDNAH